MQGPTSQSGHVLITGGAGFVGTNLCLRLLRAGRSVVVLDNLARKGVDRNARFLASQGRRNIDVVHGDVRNAELVRRLVTGARAVYHLAAQVAVTTSLVDPLHDLETNLRGTFNVLEALREQPKSVPLLYTSTNKVYGALDWLDLIGRNGRYEPGDRELRERGIGEDAQLDFHSPYGCSKGAADQYVLDYARSFGLQALVFRMSCIYGPHQCGNADQGWVAHFMLRALARLPVVIYGDGRQVRDLLFVEDLVDAMLLAVERADDFAGHAFNIGGGVANSVSLLQVIQAIGELTGAPLERSFEPPRIGDQRYFATNFERFSRLTGWAPRVGVAEGLERLKASLDRRPTAPMLVDRADDAGKLPLDP